MGIKSEQKLNWQTEYTARVPGTFIELRVWNPNGISWFWSIWNTEDDEYGAVSTLPGFATKEDAMKAATDWYENS